MIKIISTIVCYLLAKQLKAISLFKCNGRQIIIKTIINVCILFLSEHVGFDTQLNRNGGVKHVFLFLLQGQNIVQFLDLLISTGHRFTDSEKSHTEMVVNLKKSDISQTP